MPDQAKPTDKDLIALGQALHTDPALRQAALSGMASGIQGHLTKTGSSVHPGAVAGLGKLQQLGGGTSTIETNEVVRAHSDVFAIVSIKPSGDPAEETAGAG